MNLQVSPSSAAKGIAGEMLVLMEFSAGGNTETTTTDDGYGGLKDSLEEFLGGLMDDDVSESSSGGDLSSPLPLECGATDLRVLDALVSQSRGQEAALWSVREQVPVSLMQLSRTRPPPSADKSSNSMMAQQLFKYDVSLKLSEMDTLTSQVKRQMQREGYYIAEHANDLLAAASLSSDDSRRRGSLLFCCFGHAGDKNLHLNVVAAVIIPTTASGDHHPSSPSVSTLDGIQRALDRVVYKAVLAVSGSVSAEHGTNNRTLYKKTADLSLNNPH